MILVDPSELALNSQLHLQLAEPKTQRIAFASPLIRQRNVSVRQSHGTNARMLQLEVNSIVESCRCRFRYAYFELIHWMAAGLALPRSHSNLSLHARLPYRLHLRGPCSTTARAGDIQKSWGADERGYDAFP